RIGRLHIAAWLAAMMVASTTVFAEPPLRVDSVAWLHGCWRTAPAPRSVEGPIVEEQWMAPRGGTVICLGRTVRGDRTTEYELVVIREQDGRLAYEAHPSGQPSAVFLSRDVSDTSIVFENAEHDFPQRVGYRRADNGGLTAWIEGTSKGQARHVDFVDKSLPCSGT